MIYHPRREAWEIRVAGAIDRTEKSEFPVLRSRLLEQSGVQGAPKMVERTSRLLLFLGLVEPGLSGLAGMACPVAVGPGVCHCSTR